MITRRNPILITASQGAVPLRLAALWQRRSLLYFLTWRDLKVRYKQTLLGLCWILLQPVLMMLVFSVFFGFLMKVPSDGIPFPLFTFCALIPWQLFANAFSDAANSLIVNQSLITKVHFPRVIVPLSAVFARLADFACAFVVLIALMLYYGRGASDTIWALPLYVLLILANGIGVGLWLSALSVRYRDVRHMIPFVTQLWFFLSPITYPSSVVPQEWRTVYGLNPMVGAIEGFRRSLLGTGESLDAALVASVFVTVALFAGGLCYFQYKQGTLADVL